MAMNFEKLNKQWLADEMPFADDSERQCEKEALPKITAPKHKLHDDFEGGDNEISVYCK